MKIYMNIDSSYIRIYMFGYNLLNYGTNYLKFAEELTKPHSQEGWVVFLKLYELRKNVKNYPLWIKNDLLLIIFDCIMNIKMNIVYVVIQFDLYVSRMTNYCNIFSKEWKYEMLSSSHSLYFIFLGRIVLLKV